jgi:hypothetical protein
MLPNFPNRIKMLNEHVVSTMCHEAYQGLKKKKKKIKYTFFDLAQVLKCQFPVCQLHCLGCLYHNKM